MLFRNQKTRRCMRKKKLLVWYLTSGVHSPSVVSLGRSYPDDAEAVKLCTISFLWDHSRELQIWRQIYRTDKWLLWYARLKCFYWLSWQSHLWSYWLTFVCAVLWLVKFGDVLFNLFLFLISFWKHRDNSLSQMLKQIKTNHIIFQHFLRNYNGPWATIIHIFTQPQGGSIATCCSDLQVLFVALQHLTFPPLEHLLSDLHSSRSFPLVSAIPVKRHRLFSHWLMTKTGVVSR